MSSSATIDQIRLSRRAQVRDLIQPAGTADLALKARLSQARAADAYCALERPTLAGLLKWLLYTARLRFKLEFGRRYSLEGTD